MRTIQVKNIELGQGKPKICVPLIGKTEEAVLLEAEQLVKAPADLAEWRIDWFEGNREALFVTGRKLKEKFGDIPLLITFRTKSEGGEKEISTEDYGRLLVEICREKLADLLDVELFRGEELVRALVAISHENGILIVGSNHDFEKTPSKEEILYRLRKMQELDMDIPKIAVMPQKERDVLTLLDAALTMKEEYADRPFITMSMKGMGLASRLLGESFGSCITFGTVGAASAPGQIEADKLAEVLELLHTNLE